MTALVMDGVVLRAEMLAAIRAEIEDATPEAGEAPPPCLATVVVGDNPRCHIFARDKRAAAAEAGVWTVAVDLTGAATQDDVDRAIARLADDPTVDGIFVQLPIPGHVDLHRIRQLVPPAKDVDAMRPGSLHSPTTARAVVTLLDRYQVEIAGRRVVIAGHLPGMGALLTNRGADVTLTVTDPVPPGVCRSADILIAAAARPRTIGHDHVRPGAAVIDVTGDVDIQPVGAVAAAVGPYPAAVGPVAIACLLRNTLDAYRSRIQVPMTAADE